MCQCLTNYQCITTYFIVCHNQIDNKCNESLLQIEVLQNAAQNVVLLQNEVKMLLSFELLLYNTMLL